MTKKESLFILFIYLKDTEWRERRSLCRRCLLQILIQSLRRSLHELHFWSANKLAPLPSLTPPLLSRSPSSENKGKFRWIKSICSFNFFFLPFPSASFLSLPNSIFPLCTLARVFLFLCRGLASNSLGNSCLICIIRTPCFLRSMAVH